MYDNEYFVVDMASCTSTGEIINNLSLALETLNHSGKKIVLKLNDSYLNQSQMLSIQSLITSWGCTLDTVETINPDTWATAENMNIYVQKPIEKRVEDKYANQKFQPISTENNDNPITIKDVNGLHFEADLDAIKKQQDSININNDLERAGINPKDDFSAIEQQIASQYNIPSIEKKDILFEDITSKNDDLEGNIKNSIGVYKKAYDDSAVNHEWEDVDFYESPTDEPVVSDTKNTTYINQTLRSGQILESDGNVVVIGDCHPGSEIRAVGDITVWGVLSGIAHAGYKGNANAKIRALKMNAVQLRIANCYSRRPDSTNIPYIIRSSVFTPEEARIVEDDIVLFKINQN
ncbi:MAG: hypothetical protein IJ877_00985 [Candidatus Gastranaerophilales bacterium]|nr:hypothetical protein [Candidatus Gastranaerophilales bacterium]